MRIRQTAEITVYTQVQSVLRSAVIYIFSFHLRVGECVDFGATNYPKRQCFCEPGFFGINCEKVSTLDSNIYDESDYTKEDLGIVDFLYRFIDGELEAIVIGKETLSYVAIGTRIFPKAL